MAGQRKKAGESYETMPATLYQYSGRRLMFCSQDCEGDRVKTFHRLDMDTRLCSFNPRAPRGARPGKILRGPSRVTRFNPRAPRGARRLQPNRLERR